MLYRFVNQATSTISEALAEEVLEQQTDVAELLHQYSSVSLAISKYQRINTPLYREKVIAALFDVSSQLEIMRSNYSFERLDGAAKAHAYVKPVIEDVSDWFTRGIGSHVKDSNFVADFSAQRLDDRISILREIVKETDGIAQSLISEQRIEIGNFRDSLLLLLLNFAILISLVFLLLIRQRNLQAQIGKEQQNRSQGLIEAETRGRKKAESALSESANVRRKILDVIPENIAMIDSNGIIAATNKQWQMFVSKNNRKYDDGGVGHSFDAVYGGMIDGDIDGRKDILANIDLVRNGGKELRAIIFF